MNNKKIIFLNLGIYFLLIMSLLGCSKNNNNPVTINEKKMDNNNILFNTYDIDTLSNYGKINPNAPSETSQFNFMIGRFECTDSLLVGDEYKASMGAWETHYILNGYGVRDVYRNEKYAGESIRFYNSEKKKWDVYFFGMPDEFTGLWEGEHIDGKMIMKQNRKGPEGETMLSKLTFYNISETSFDWKGELINMDADTSTVFWKISAIRQK